MFTCVLSVLIQQFAISMQILSIGKTLLWSTNNLVHRVKTLKALIKDVYICMLGDFALPRRALGTLDNETCAVGCPCLQTK